MQNKYKLPDHVKGSALSVVKCYEAYKHEIKDEENKILSLGGSNYESFGNERVFLPNGKGGNLAKKVYQDGKVRRLTPLEYERLQTLPDNYTAGVADSHRYTAIGNGWTVDVIAHIFKHIRS